MANITINCPGCGAEYGLGPEFAGQKVECAQCGRKFVVEQVSPQATMQVPSTSVPAATMPAGGVQATLPLQRIEGANIATATWQPGDVLLNLYEVKQVFESGGMGLVYRVHHRGWGVDLALKSPRAEYFQTPDHKENFIREAETWVNLGLHPHTVSCHYVREIEGIPRVFAEYVESGSLSDWISSGRLYEGGPAKALERIIDVAIQFAWGLHYAHEQGLVHQDVKPGNVMLTAEGVAKVTDFGLAKARAAAAQVTVGGTQRSILVSSGGMTPAYCSPEQANGEALSRKTDLWSWALSVLEMFAGEVTWMAGQAAAEAMESYLENGAENAAIPQMPAGVAALLKQCFQRDTAARPRDMLVVAGELQRICREVIGHAYPRQQPKAAEARADALNNRAISLLDIGQAERAEALLTEALQVEAGHREVTFNLGLLRWRQGKQTDQEFLEGLVAAAEAGGDAGQWAHWRGLAHLERGDAEGAAKELNAAIERGLTETEVWQSLGIAQAAAGELESAEAALCNAAGIGASDGETASLLAAVRQARHNGPPVAPVTAAKSSTLLADLAARRSHCARVLTGARQPLLSVAVSPDGCRVAAGDCHRSLWLWHLPADDPPVACDGHRGPVPLVWFTPAGNHLLSGGLDGSFLTWDARTGESQAKHLVPTAGLRCLALTPSRERVLLIDEQGGAQFLSIASGQAVRLSQARLHGVTEAAFIHGDQTLLTLGKANLLLWNLAEEKMLANHPTQVTSTNICMAVGVDGQLVLCGCNDGEVRLWSLETGQCVRVFHGHRAPVTSLVILPGGEWFVSAANDQTVRLWNLATGRCWRTLEDRGAKTNALAASPDGRWVVSAGEDKAVRLWRVPTTSLQLAPYLICRPKSALEMIQVEVSFERLMAEAHQAAVADDLETAYARLRMAMTLPGFERAPQALGRLRALERRGRRAGLRSLWERGGLEARGTRVVAVAAEADVGVSGGTDGKLHLWNIRTGEEKDAINGPYNSITQIACAPDGGRVAVAGPSTVVKVVNAGQGEVLASLEGHRARITGLNYSPDGSLLATADQAGEIRIWQDRTNCLGVMKGGRFAVTEVAFSPDNRYLAGVDGAGRVDVWAMEKGVSVRRFLPRPVAITSVAFSPGGAYLLCGCRNGTVQMFHLASGGKTAEWAVGDSPVLGLAFSPEGQFILAATQAGTVSLWNAVDARQLGSLQVQSGAVGSLALSRDGSIAFVTSAIHADRMGLVEIDWDLQFPRCDVLPEAAGEGGAGTALPDDQPWAGLSGLEMAVRVCEQRVRRYALPAAILAGLLVVLAGVVATLVWKQTDVDQQAIAKAGKLMDALKTVLPAHSKSTNLVAEFYVGDYDEVMKKLIRSTPEHIQVEDYQKAAERILTALKRDKENQLILIKALRHPEPKLRRELIKIVSLNASTEVKLAVLTEALGDGNTEVFASVMGEFLRLGRPAIPALEEAARDSRNPRIRHGAAMVLDSMPRR